MADNEYWASADRDAIAAEMRTRAKRHYDLLDQSGRLNVYRRSVRTYYMLDKDGGWSNSSVTFTGEQGELVEFSDNHYRSLIKHTIVMTTGSRPAFDARARNNDYQSRAQAELSNGLIDYYMSEYKLEHLARLAVEYALLEGEGWISMLWDPKLGKAVDAVVDTDPKTGDETHHTVNAGDITVAVHSPVDVIRSASARNGNHQWLMLRMDPVNKYDLAAQYPDLADEILSASMDEDAREAMWSRDGHTSSETHEDFVRPLHFFHQKTPSMPEGRLVQIVGTTVLFDGPLPYATLPIIEMVPAREKDTAFGFSGFWTLLPLQQILDSVMSTIATNHDAVGVQNIWTETGSDLQVNDLVGGMQHIESRTKPEPLQLLQTSDDSYKLLDVTKQDMQTLSGINDTARGNPDPNVKSGAMAALLHSMASQYNSDIQGAYGELIQGMATKLIELLQTFATHPRLADIVGAGKAPMLKEFTGADLASVHRVAVDLGNPLTRTTAGKLDLAEKLVAQFPDAITPEQYLEVMSTGRLEPVFKAASTEQTLIAQENDELAKGGEEIKVMLTDDHARHIDEHRTLLASPGSRLDEELAQRVLDHIQKHMKMWPDVPPALLAATGQQPAPEPPMPPGMEGGDMPPNPDEGAPGGPMGPPPPMNGPVPGEPPPVEMPGQDPAIAAAMPSMPINPLTNEPASTEVL